MARRFTDTEKWRDDWWGSLSNDYRMIWLYLVDSCSIAGIWKKDFRGLNFNCNTSITEEEFKNVFKGRVVERATFYFIPKFVFYQNPKNLNSDKPAVVSIRKELELYNVSDIVQKLFGNDYLIIKGIGKGNGIGMEKVKEKPPEKLEIFKALFSDQAFIEGLSLTHKGKDIKNAFEECYIHHSSGTSPPRLIGEWKQKLNTWLSNTNTPKNGFRNEIKGGIRRADATIEGGKPFGEL